MQIMGNKYYYAIRKKSNQNAHVAIFNLDVGGKDYNNRKE